MCDLTSIRDKICQSLKDLSLCQQHDSVFSSTYEEYTHKITNSMDDSGNNKGYNPSPISNEHGVDLAHI